MMSIEERLAALEARCRAAEDHLEIQNLLVSYGPLVDSGSDQDAVQLWVDGGGYNFGLPDGSTGRLVAFEELSGLYRSKGHMSLVNTGCSHLTATPKITVDGDDAQAVGYSFVVLREGERWYLWRAAINHWVLKRAEAGWRIVERFNRTLDGSEISHETMRKVTAI
jgi:hypothetical protein